MELSIIKNDVINELQSNRYFNEQELGRLVQTITIPHRERVVMIAHTIRENAAILDALKLVEVYFPANATASAIPPDQNIVTE